jgi:type IV secretion system protein VirB5
MVLASMLGVSMLANIYLGRQPKVVPHIIEVDSLGEANYRGPVGESFASFAPNEALVRYQLRRFIELTRTVSSDNVLLRKSWFDAYKMLTITGNTLMTDWVGANDPFKRAQKETTAVEILSAVPLSAESWQIDWKETTWDKSGQTMGKPIIWRAMLKIVLQPPTNRQQMIDNPLGLFVDEFHWDRIQQVRP